MTGRSLVLGKGEDLPLALVILLQADAEDLWDAGDAQVIAVVGQIESLDSPEAVRNVTLQQARHISSQTARINHGEEHPAAVVRELQQVIGFIVERLAEVVKTLGNQLPDILDAEAGVDQSHHGQVADAGAAQPGQTGGNLLGQLPSGEAVAVDVDDFLIVSFIHSTPGTAA